ncbi:aminoacyl-tRNA hydrolase [Candidatus Jorgensenbacteria bacterium]|nr:aminoacyl-tRNA hydrolase [Candidatus Jorgensenbacteria bacterium]
MDNKFNAYNLKLSMGLGNPGHEYEHTYHNVGYGVIEYLTQKRRKKRLPNTHFSYTKRGGLILIKPLTFMNEAGRAAQEAVRVFKTKTEEIVVIHDDSDIEFGTYKLQFGRGSAGHRGVASIIKTLGTSSFWRIRIGIRKKSDKTKKRIKASELVLANIVKDDAAILTKVFKETEKILFPQK